MLSNNKGHKFSNISWSFKKWIIGHKLLLVTLLLGFILRIFPILWGVPLTPYTSSYFHDSYISSYHPDEPKVLQSLVKFPSIVFTSQPFPGYGTTLQYILGILFLPAKLFFVKYMKLYTTYGLLSLILARIANVVIGTASIYFTYRLAIMLFNNKVAMFAAALLATSFYHTLNSAVFTLDVAMGFLLIINFIACFHAVNKNNRKDYILLGIVSGLLLGTKITGGIFLLIPFVLNFLIFYESQLPNIQKRSQLLQQAYNLLTYVIVAFFVFFLSNPHIFINPAKYITFFLEAKHNWLDRTQTSIVNMLGIWGKRTVVSVGLPVTGLAIFGALIPGRSNLRYKAMLLILLVSYYGFWRWMILPRYIITIAPLICIFAGNACYYLMCRKMVVFKVIGMGMLLISVGFSAYLCISGILLRLNDTRPRAAEYISKTIPDGTSIGIAYTSEKYKWKWHSWRYPKVNFKRYKEVPFLDKPDIIILSSEDFEHILKTLNSDKFKSKYVLDKSYYKEWYNYSPPTPKIFRFYDELFNSKNSKYNLLKIFKIDVNVPIEFPPPEIRIYGKYLR